MRREKGKTGKRFLAVCLSATLAFSMVPAAAFSAFAEENDGVAVEETQQPVAEEPAIEEALEATSEAELIEGEAVAESEDITVETAEDAATSENGKEQSKDIESQDSNSATANSGVATKAKRTVAARSPQSSGTTHDLSSYIKSLEVKDDLASIASGDKLTIKFGWLIEGEVQGGVDKYTYQLPLQFAIADAATGRITKGSGGEAIGTWRVDTNGLVTIAYDNSYNTSSQTTINYMEITGEANYDPSSTDNKIEFKWSTGSRVIVVTNPGDFTVKKTAQREFKNGVLSHDSTIQYKVAIQSELGTNGKDFNISDSIKTTGFSGEDSVEIDPSSFVLKKGDATVPVSAAVSLDKRSFTIENIPALAGGESYELTYNAKVYRAGRNVSIWADPAAVENTVSVTNDGRTKTGTAKVNYHEVLVKTNGTYNSVSNKVDWDIYVRPGNANVSGFVLSDTIDAEILPGEDNSGVVLWTRLVGADSNTSSTQEVTVSQDKKSFSVTFPDQSNVSYYLIKYSTKANPVGGETLVTNNKAELNGGNEMWTVQTKNSAKGIGKTEVNKSFASMEKNQDGTVRLYWKSTANYTYANSKTTIADTIGDPEVSRTYSNSQGHTWAGWDRYVFPEGHYGVVDEIYAQVKESLQITVADKNGQSQVLTYDQAKAKATEAGGSLWINCYTSSDKKQQVRSGDSTKVKYFTVEIDKLQVSDVEFSYFTHFDTSKYSKGSQWKIPNKLTSNSVSSKPEPTYFEALPAAGGIDKQAAISSDHTFVSGSYTFDYDKTNGELTFRLLATMAEGETSLTVTDQLPEGFAIVSDSVRVGNYNKSLNRIGSNWQSNNNVSITYPEASNDNLLTVNVNNIGTSLKLRDDNVVVIQYKVKVDSSFATMDGAELDRDNGMVSTRDFVNTATKEGENGGTSSFISTVVKNEKILEKSGQQIRENDANTARVHYTVNINPQALDLLESGDVLTLTDTVTSERLDFKLDAKSIKLYTMNIDGSRGEEAEPLSVHVEQPATENGVCAQSFTIQVKDATAYILEYDVVADRRDDSNAATSGTIDNTIKMEGYSTATDSTEARGISVRATSNHAGLQLVKVDEDNNTKFLTAHFKVEKYGSAGFETVYEDIEVSGENGYLFDYLSEKNKLTGNTLYKVTETAAPEGYKIDTTPFYFIVRGQAVTNAINSTDITPVSEDEAKDIAGTAGSGVADDAIHMLLPDTNSYFEIANSVMPTVDIDVEKIWSDYENADGTRPEAVVVKLLANGIATGDELNISADDQGNWTGKFENLPQFDGKGETISYTVEETAVEGYASSVSGDAENGFKILNTYVADTNVPVVKVWNDADNQDGARPDSVTVKLLANGVETEKTLTLNAANNWKGVFTDLAKYNDTDQLIAYTVQEQNVPAGYVATVSGDIAQGYTITNSHNPEVVEVSGSKTWVDFDNRSGKRPDAITIHLLADGSEIDVLNVTEENEWSWTFADLPKYRDQGVEIEYTITEDTVEGYLSRVDGFNVENTITSVRVSKVDVADGTELSGAHIQILDEQGIVVEEWDSVAGTQKVVEGLKTGVTYTLRETVAPEGYALTADTTFSLDENGVVTSSGTTVTDDEGNVVMLVEDTKLSEPSQPDEVDGDNQNPDKPKNSEPDNGVDNNNGGDSGKSHPKTGDSLFALTGFAIVVAVLAGLGLVAISRRKELD